MQRRRRSDGTIVYRGWATRGTARIYSEAFANEQDAYDAACRMRRANAIQGDDLTLEAAGEMVVDEARQKRAAGTRRWYQDHLRAIHRLIPPETPLVHITAETLEEFVRERLREVKAATVNAHLRCLHRVFAVAVRRGHVDRNPVKLIDRPRADAPPIDWFTEAELADVLGKVDAHTSDVLALFAMTGVRRAEAARLEPGHVRLHLGQLVVPGKRGTRVVPVGDDLVAPLRRLLAKAGDALLPGGVHAIDDLFREARKTVGDRRLHPHALRHTFGTALIRAGVRPDVVMRLMGHRSLQTTLRYVHEVGQDGVDAIARLRIVRPHAPARDQ